MEIERVLPLFPYQYTFLKSLPPEGSPVLLHTNFVLYQIEQHGRNQKVMAIALRKFFHRLTPAVIFSSACAVSLHLAPKAPNLKSHIHLSSSLCHLNGVYVFR